jgi:hypothetical protein
MDKDTLKAMPSKIKNHLVRNKFAYAAGAVAIGAIALQQSNAKAFKEFLISKEIDPQEFLNPEKLAEIE